MGKKDPKTDPKPDDAGKDENPLDVAVKAVMAKYADRLAEAEGTMPAVALVGEIQKSVVHFMRAAELEEPPYTQLVWKVAQAVCGPVTEAKDE